MERGDLAADSHVLLIDYMGGGGGVVCVFFFFFSSRRRHTRLVSDWSSDVCSSDLGAMQLSTYVGATLGLILFTFARPLLKAIIGNDAISPAVFTAAMKYVRIRADRKSVV